MNAPVTGGCQCGAVRYAMATQPQGGICHCRMCQRATGGPFAALTGVKKADFRWTKGEPAWFSSSTVARRPFCRECGTPLGFEYVQGPIMDVMAGTLDEPERANIRSHVGVEARLSWLKMCDGLPEHQTGETSSIDLDAGFASHQAGAA
jgi:hypothetical protein